jgi:hypothetical protein
MWFTRRPVILATLMIYSCIISLVGIYSYSNSYLLTCLAISWIYGITISKSTYDIRVIIFHAALTVVLLVKVEEKIMLAKEVGHVIV